ncbi:MAG: family 43 glycosylhydrolase [Verrucomicrobiales bacterium]|nr:family 43 glycosylhydrolase [Verrucomicrobiales bacterium]MCP5528100.1 family 43 glycosylhydrolase [Verrucomicrobiales bacterium]
MNVRSVHATLLGAVLMSLALMQAAGPPRITGLEFGFSAAEGLGLEPGICRRDPSDVIRVKDRYFVFFTKVNRDELPPHRRSLYPSGYAGTVWYAFSTDGRHWTEGGEALGCGAAGAFDAHAVFTPNVLVRGGRCWLYYTGVKPTPGQSLEVFENNNHDDFTAIGVAVADQPEGPFKRVSPEPILTVGEDAERFDSYRVDDACLLVRDGRIWLYYKGRSLRHGGAGPRHTEMGVAVAERPEGPFRKVSQGASVLNSGHEVQVWGGAGGGVLCLVSDTGPQARTLQWAPDGLAFRPLLGELRDLPKAPGLFRPELTDPAVVSDGAVWGISMAPGPHPHLVRYDGEWQTGAGQ